ncbi:MAG: branched-chain amino acid ABC transporter permease [Desulfatiglandales bacterium]
MERIKKIIRSAVSNRYGKGFFLLTLFFIPLITNNYTQYMVNLIMVYIIIAIGLNILLGYAGQFAFAHPAFVGIGAYCTGLLMVRLHIPFWFALPTAGIFTAGIGLVVGFPAIRMKGLYLAMVTLAFVELTEWILIHWEPVTFGADGFNLPSPKLGPFVFETDTSCYFIIMISCVLLVFLARNLMASGLGRAFVAIRNSEVAAESVAISAAKYKCIAFMISAFYAGIGGGLYALAIKFIDPESFGLNQIILQFAIVLIGGLRSIYGSILGAILLTSIPELLRGFKAFEEIGYGFLLVVFILFMPSGISGFLKKHGFIPEERLHR